jgi:hypothetical protein
MVTILQVDTGRSQHPQYPPQRNPPTPTNMHKPLTASITLALGFIALALPSSTQAGKPLYGPTGHEAKGPGVSPLNPVPGSMTLGGAFGRDLQSIYLDSITPFWRPGNATIFLNTRNTYNDSQQYEASYGLGLRFLVPDYDVIFGVNAFYDAIDSQFENQFHSGGFGAEILTRWVDARFNYYLPASDDILVGNSSRRTRSSFTDASGATTTTTRVQKFRTLEANLEGWNAEVGFLIPGLDRYMETRVFGGYYHYNNPFGSDFEGFKARLEARFLPGVIGTVEWWDDSYLTGGHWTGDVRVSVPFSFFNLFSGRNPFEGASESFRPRQREFRERVSDMVIRSHRVKTVKSGRIETSDKTSRKQSGNPTPQSVSSPTPPPSTPDPEFGPA